MVKDVVGRAGVVVDAASILGEREKHAAGTLAEESEGWAVEEVAPVLLPTAAEAFGERLIAADVAGSAAIAAISGLHVGPAGRHGTSFCMAAVVEREFCGIGIVDKL